MPMMKIIGVAIAVFLSTFTGSAEATSINEYFDDASWKAAAAGYSIHPYTGGVTITTYTYTIEIVGPGEPFIVFDPVIESYHQPNLSSLYGDFSFGSPCDTVPGCLITNLRELDVVFDHPVLGIEFYQDVFFPGSNYQLSILPGNWSLLDYASGWFGLFGGPISKLAFVSSGFTDSPNAFRLHDIVVATAPEPASLALATGGLAYFGVRGRKAKRVHRE